MPINFESQPKNVIQFEKQDIEDIHRLPRQASKSYYQALPPPPPEHTKFNKLQIYKPELNLLAKILFV
jgi:hypothetical protein